ncbi:MAG: cytidine deaminase [Myxococcota bacterium]
MARTDKKSRKKASGGGDEELIAAALQAREHAYAPYSHFKVGAALRSASGDVIAGCNVENAAYGLSICAERNAVGRAVVLGHRRFDAVAVTSDISPPAPPCGQCLQTLAEFSDDMEVILANPKGEVIKVRLHQLLPFRFKPEMLAK